MIKKDLALKGNLDGVELLIFPSNQLPEKSQRKATVQYLVAISLIGICGLLFEVYMNMGIGMLILLGLHHEALKNMEYWIWHSMECEFCNS